MTGLARLRRCAGVVLLCMSALGYAQTPAPDPVGQRSVSDWLLRMHEASRQRAYVGTFVVSTGRVMSSARIWHVCDGTQQMERVESLRVRRAPRFGTTTRY